jgi:hypothetical protein
MRLLVLGCSQRKKSVAGAVAAIDLYDGPAFRTLRRFIADGGRPPRTVIASGKHGLIESDRRISSYDQSLKTADDRLRGSVSAGLTKVLRDGVDAVFVSAGGSYLEAMRSALETVPASAIEVAVGPPGVRAAQLRSWLTQGPGSGRFPARREGGTLSLAGIPVPMSKPELEMTARARLLAEASAATRFHSWYALLDGRPVSVKWLASVASGLPVSRFSTHTACRLVAALGFEVRSE